MARKYTYAYKVRIDQETLPALQELAGDFCFLVTTPGRYFGEPSPAALLDALAAVYRADPEGTHLAFTVLLEANGLLPTSNTTEQGEQ